LASVDYIRGRWALDGLRMRPQAILWSDNFGSISTGGASAQFQLAVPDGVEGENFIILSDDNRSELNFNKERIENRQRMINGSMRSYHVADKLNMSLSWDMLPSRSFSSDPLFNSVGKPSAPQLAQYTSDNGAGGVEILDWYENHKGPFWMFLAYDKYNEFSSNKYNYLAQYNQLIQVYFSAFDYSVVKRGGTNFDFWNISLTLEEV
jgi:hypothetical protein